MNIAIQEILQQARARPETDRAVLYAFGDQYHIEWRSGQDPDHVINTDSRFEVTMPFGKYQHDDNKKSYREVWNIEFSHCVTLAELIDFSKGEVPDMFLDLVRHRKEKKLYYGFPKNIKIDGNVYSRIAIPAEKKSGHACFY